MRISLACFTLLAASSVTFAQPAKSPEQLLSADCLAYFRYDGYEPHRKAYDQTALAQAMKEGLGDFFDHAFTQLSGAAAGDLFAGKKQKGPPPKTGADGFLDCISKNGFALGLEVASARLAAQGAEDMFHLTLVFPHGGEKKNQDALKKFFNAIASTLDAPVEDSVVQGRAVQTASFGQVKAAWWTEGKHLVCAVGANAVNRSLLVIDGRRPNLTTAKWHRDFAAFKGYETDMRGYIDLESIVDRIAIYGLEEPGLENLKERFQRHLLLRHLGLTGLKDFTFHLGFDGKFQRSTVRLGVVESDKRTGLLRLISGPIAHGLDKLPPLPPDADYVSVRHVDWNGISDFVRTSYGLLAVSNLLGGELPARFPDLNRLIGGDFKKDFLDQLDTTVVCYGGHSEGPFFLGQGFAVKVKDAKKVSKALEAITKEIGRNSPDFIPEKRTYRGADMFVFTKLPMPVTYTVHDGWLVGGLFPTPVQGFVMRSGGKYRTWKIPAEAEEALAKEKKANGKSKLLGVSVSDPRPAIEMGLAILPLLVHTVNYSASSTVLDLSKIPNAQSINEWVFPNTAFFYDDGKALRWENHYSINELDDFFLLMFTPYATELLSLIPMNKPARGLKGGAGPAMPIPVAPAPPNVAPPGPAGLQPGTLPPPPPFPGIPEKLAPPPQLEKPVMCPATAVDKDGKVLVTVVTPKMVSYTVARKVPYTVTEAVNVNGVNKFVEKTRYKEVLETHHRKAFTRQSFVTDGKEVRVSRKDGKAVEPKDLPKLLEKETQVLLVRNGDVPAAELKKLDERTLIIRIVPGVSPPPVFPGKGEPLLK